MLVVLGVSHKNKHGHLLWTCRCDCGNVKAVIGSDLRRTRVKSCGCTYHLKTTTHGMSQAILHRRWIGLRQRCHNPNGVAYKHYGGRGIRVCGEWDAFKAFCEWSNANGYSPDLELDRIDVNGPYSPENCRWVTRQVNCCNMRRNVYILVYGERLALAEAGRRYDIRPHTIRARMSRGWTAEEAVSTPVNIWANRRKRGTDTWPDRIVIAKRKAEEADKVAKRIEAAPVVPGCKTPPEIMGADL